MKERIFIILIIFFSVSLVHSRGSMEKDQIAVAKELLEDKKYNEAIAVLTAYMSENPAVIYEVQPLLDDIREKRDQNNRDMDELIHVLFDLEDVDKAYELIEEIKKNNPYPDALSKNFIKDARQNATLVINKKKFKNYMDEALIDLNRREYIDALNNYLLCLDFHIDEFDLLIEELTSSSVKETDLTEVNDDTSLAGTYTSLKNSSYREVDDIKRQTEELKEYLVDLKLAYESALLDIEAEEIYIDNLIRSLEIFKEVPLYLNNYKLKRDQLAKNNSLFINVSAEGYSSKYISFAALTLTGREGKEEGFINLVERLYPHYLEELVTKLEDRLDSEITLALDLYESGEYLEAKDKFNSGINSSLALLETSSIWKSFIKLDKNFNLVGSDILKERYAAIGDSVVSSMILKSYIDLSDYMLFLEENAGISNSELELYRGSVLFRLNEIDSSYSSWQAEENDINTRAVLKYRESPIRVRRLNNEFEKIIDLYRNREIDTVTALSKNYYTDIFNRDIDSEDEIRDVMADNILDASRPTDKSEIINVYFGINSTDERSVTTYNPETALANLNSIETEYEDYIISLLEYFNKFEGEKDYIFNNIDFNKRFENVRNAIELANSNKESLQRYKNEANNKITLSRESENRGFSLYERALTFFERERFKEAKEIIETGKQVSELAITYSQNRAVIDELIPALYNLEDRIIQEEAKIVIRDVRRLINQGKNQYLEGAYIPASNLFKEAELRWGEINTEAHPEIPYWLALIKDALAIESGRYLSITDPLYSVLAGYLSFAEKNYREGLKSLNKVEKLKYFAKADSYLLKIIEVKPLNERARFLQLRVLKSKDPEAFKVIFNNDFIRYRNSVIRDIEDIVSLSSSQVESLITSYEAIIRDSYLRNPRLSGSLRRKKLERFYKPVETQGKSAAAVNREKQEIEDKRKSINESYIKFKDLYKIAEGSQKNSVKRIIDISEVALGFKRLPVDTSNIRESNRIFTQARGRLNSTNQSEIEVLNSILQDLKRALTLNPGNEDIPVIIDDILVMLGEESNFQLQPREDKIFREAQKDFIDGRYFDARDKIIEILQANRKNKNYPKLKELIKRVEVKLKEEINI